MMQKLIYCECDVKRLRLKPGDVVVLSTDRRIDDEMARKLQEKLVGIFPDHKVLVVSGGFKLKSMTPRP